MRIFNILKDKPGAFISVVAWRYLFGFFKGTWGRLIATSVGSVIQALVIIPILLLIRHVLDVIIPQKLINDLIWAGLAIIVIRILGTGFTLYLRSINIRIMTTIVYRIREDLMRKIYTFSQAYYAREDQRLLQTRIVMDTERIANMNHTLVSGVIPAVLLSAGLAVILVVLNWSLFLIILALFPFIYFTNQYLAHVTSKKVYSFQRSFEGFSKVTSFVMKFMELIKIQSTEELESRKQTEILEDLRDKTTSMTYAFSVSGQVQTFLVGISGIMVLIFGGISVVKGMMTLGDFFVFFIAANQLQNNINILNSSFSTIITGNESLIILHGIANHDDTEPYFGELKTEFNNNITLTSVSFQYDKKPVLQDINLNIVKGKSIAIIGPNGAGKSTLINLVLGFYMPRSGTITANGIYYADLDFQHFRKSIGVVLQYPPLIPGTIGENIKYGNENRNSDEIKAVSKLS
ncbi:MAG: ABC transporter ATP-binding protein, partial [Bacteroidia bacterium]|nr:ABC transporter ATP-binding protein [Bacteroidia bacterium]